MIEVAQTLGNIAQNVFTSDPFELNAATGRQVREIHFNLLIDPAALCSEQCTEFPVYPVFSVRLPDKIQYRQTILLWRMAQATTELLEKNGETFSRAQEQNQIDLRYIHALAEDMVLILGISPESAATSAFSWGTRKARVAALLRC